MVEEIIGRLPELSGAQLARLKDVLRRERWRRWGPSATAGGGDAAAPVTEVLEYRPHEDGHLQLELRCYVRRDGSARERGPYWNFQFHEGGKRKRSSTSARPATRRALWSPSGQSPQASRVCLSCPSSTLFTELDHLTLIGPCKRVKPKPTQARRGATRPSRRLLEPIRVANTAVLRWTLTSSQNSSWLKYKLRDCANRRVAYVTMDDARAVQSP